jgi:hypothetical protein
MLPAKHLFTSLQSLLMKQRLIILLLLAGCVHFTACQKDIEIFIPDAGQLTTADTSWNRIITATSPVSQLLTTLQLPLHQDTINPFYNNSYQLNSGIYCSIQANSLTDSAGNLVTQKVDLQSLLLYKKGDIVRMNKSTVTETGRALQTNGILLLDLKKNEQAVLVKPGKTVFTSIHPASSSGNNRLYFEKAGNNNCWQLNTDLQNSIETVQDRLQINTSRLQWIFAGDYTDSAAQNNGKILLQLPPHYTNYNSIAYLVYKNHHTVIRLNDDIGLRKFYCANIAAGHPAMLLLISKQADDYYFTAKEIETPAATATFQLHPVKTSAASVQQYLDGL